MRSEVGKDAAEYLHRLSVRGWLLPVDFSFFTSFLLSSDRFTYESYIEYVRRAGFPVIFAIKRRIFEVEV